MLSFSQNSIVKKATVVSLAKVVEVIRQVSVSPSISWKVIPYLFFFKGVVPYQLIWCIYSLLQLFFNLDPNRI